MESNQHSPIHQSLMLTLKLTTMKAMRCYQLETFSKSTEMSKKMIMNQITMREKSTILILLKMSIHLMEEDSQELRDQMTMKIGLTGIREEEVFMIITGGAMEEAKAIMPQNLMSLMESKVTN